MARPRLAMRGMSQSAPDPARGAVVALDATDARGQRSATGAYRVFGNSKPAPFSITVTSSVMSLSRMPANMACLYISRAA